MSEKTERYVGIGAEKGVKMTENEAIDVLNMIVAHGPLPIDAKKAANKKK